MIVLRTVGILNHPSGRCRGCTVPESSPPNIGTDVIKPSCFDRGNVSVVLHTVVGRGDPVIDELVERLMILIQTYWPPDDPGQLEQRDGRSTVSDSLTLPTMSCT